MKLLREVFLGVGLASAAALVVWGVAGWSQDLAKIVAGVLVAGITYLFVAEAR